MACPHCGDHLIHKQGSLLHCCGCSRPRHDLVSPAPLQALARHAPLLLMGLLVMPVVFGLSSINAVLAPTAVESAQRPGAAD